jgi:hypothetical protein
MSIFTSTANGAVAYKTTGNPLTDLFFNIGASRKNPDGVKSNFDSAMAFDMNKAAAMLLYARDIRHGGAGERSVFRTLFAELIKSDVVVAEKVLRLIPDCGRFDDLSVAYGTPLERIAVGLWVDALKAGNALAAKWADRSDKKLQRALGLNEAALRKFISKIRKDTLVETAMCEQKWSEIAYNKLPSVAGLRYAKAFKKHDEARFTDFMKADDTKVNASVAYPYDVYRTYKAGQTDAASKYWDNLADLCAEGNILVIPDVSGSMGCEASGSVTCMDVSVSLGVYLAQRIKGVFQNKLVTFSENPTIVTLPKTKNLGELFSFVERMDWGGSTNFEAVFKLVLAEAKRAKAKPEDMPKMLLVLSDMQFNPSSRGGTLHDTMRAAYEEAGYAMPAVVYWNLNASHGNVPTMGNKNGVAMVSGFSPKVLESVLAAKTITPVTIMEEAIAPFVKMLEK